MAGELDAYYLPNRWTKRFPSGEILEKHLEIIKRANNNIRTKVPCTLDIPYGTMAKEKLNIFGTDLEEDAPVIIFFHGGYWCDKTITKESYEYLAENFYKNRIKTIFVGYELCPDLALERIVQEANEALKFCLNYAKSSRGVYLMGHSSGAHLIATIFMDSFAEIPENFQDLIKGAFLLCGIYDLEPISLTVINSALGLDKRSAKLSSPFHHKIITGKETNFYLFCGEFDAPGFKKQAANFREKLEISGIPSKFEIVDSVDHFDIIELFQDDRYKLTKFVIEVVKNEE